MLTSGVTSRLFTACPSRSGAIDFGRLQHGDLIGVRIASIDDENEPIVDVAPSRSGGHAYQRAAPLDNRDRSI